MFSTYRKLSPKGGIIPKDVSFNTLNIHSLFNGLSVIVTVK